ncbi:hypothetical protein CPAV1605_243 [seawater metagenome]|uniref:Uncharacterized protein n=1 Tax=seawater metagenome TaxID=1561972 RepID=A0A5E8CGH4_9ZZZZ
MILMVKFIKDVSNPYDFYGKLRLIKDISHFNENEIDLLDNFLKTIYPVNYNNFKNDNIYYYVGNGLRQSLISFLLTQLKLKKDKNQKKEIVVYIKKPNYFEIYNICDLIPNIILTDDKTSPEIDIEYICPVSNPSGSVNDPESNAKIIFYDFVYNNEIYIDKEQIIPKDIIQEREVIITTSIGKLTGDVNLRISISFSNSKEIIRNLWKHYKSTIGILAIADWEKFKEKSDHLIKNKDSIIKKNKAIIENNRNKLKNIPWYKYNIEIIKPSDKQGSRLWIRKTDNSDITKFFMTKNILLSHGLIFNASKEYTRISLYSKDFVDTVVRELS